MRILSDYDSFLQEKALGSVVPLEFPTLVKLPEVILPLLNTLRKLSRPRPRNPAPLAGRHVEDLKPMHLRVHLLRCILGDL